MNFFKEAAAQIKAFSEAEKQKNAHRFRTNTYRQYKTPVGKTQEVIFLEDSFKDFHTVFVYKVADKESKYTSGNDTNKFGHTYLIPLPQFQKSNVAKNRAIDELIGMSGLKTGQALQLMLATVLYPHSYVKKATGETVKQWKKGIMMFGGEAADAYGDTLLAAHKEFGTLKGVRLMSTRVSQNNSCVCGIPKTFAYKVNGEEKRGDYQRLSTKTLQARIQKDIPDWFSNYDLEPFDYSKMFAPATPEEVAEFFHLDIDSSPSKNVSDDLDDLIGSIDDVALTDDDDDESTHLSVVELEDEDFVEEVAPAIKSKFDKVRNGKVAKAKPAPNVESDDLDDFLEAEDDEDEV